MSSDLSPVTVCVMAGPDSDHQPDEDSRLDFSIEAEMNQLSPLVSYKTSQEVRLVTCPGPGPATSIMVRESPPHSYDDKEEDQDQDQEEKDQEEQEEQVQEKEEVKKDLLSPPSVASSLVCLQAQRRSSLSLAEQKFKSM